MDDHERIQIEFEFIQNLSNPAYLHFLAQNRYFSNEKFMNFLVYLQYWKQPEYCKHLVFPQCLAFLDALVNIPAFRRNLAHQDYRNYIHQQQAAHWLHPEASIVTKEIENKD